MRCSNGSAAERAAPRGGRARLGGALLALALAAPVQALDGDALLEYFRNDTHRLRPADNSARLAKVVARVTGLPLGPPVAIVELPREEARGRLDAPRIDDPEAARVAEGESRLLRHFGLLGDGESYGDWFQRVGSRGTQGLYLPDAGHILLVSGIGSRAQTRVLLHELVHAAQDRSTSLVALQRDHAATLDQTLALSALVEGQAELAPVLIQVDRARSQLEGQDPVALLSARYEELLGGLDDGLGTLDALVGFPYSFGPYLVINRLGEKGTAGFAGMLRDPPATTEQVLHGEKLARREAALPVRLSARADALARALGADSRYGTSAGEYFIRTLLAPLAPEQRAAAAAGWGGDRLLLVGRKGRGDLLVWDTRWDSPADAEEFRQGYLAWAKERLGVAAGERVAPFDFVAPGLLLHAAGDRVLIVEGEGAEEERTRRAVAGVL
ncbi:hypothetical protein [Endothiovibrio diazotrophicus]